MRGSNLRILIFIDLLATALGSSIILMMVLSVNKGKTAAAQAGAPRNFIYYKVSSPDTGANLSVVVKSGDTNEWTEISNDYRDEADNSFFLKEKNESVQNNNGKILIWGPVTEFTKEHNVAKEYNVFSTIQKSGEWVLGVLYHDNSRVNDANPAAIDDSIEIIHTLRWPGKKKDSTVHSWVTLGNYSVIKFKVDAK